MYFKIQRKSKNQKWIKRSPLGHGREEREKGRRAQELFGCNSLAIKKMTVRADKF